MTADLVAFLNARLDEDEAEQARDVVTRRLEGGWHNTDCSTYDYDPQPCDCGVPARVLADVQAKRAILGFCKAMIGGHDEPIANQILKFLTHPFANDPDFDPAWKP